MLTTKTQSFKPVHAETPCTRRSTTMITPSGYTTRMPNKETTRWDNLEQSQVVPVTRTDRPPPPSADVLFQEPLLLPSLLGKLPVGQA